MLKIIFNPRSQWIQCILWSQWSQEFDFEIRLVLFIFRILNLNLNISIFVCFFCSNKTYCSRSSSINPQSQCPILSNAISLERDPFALYLQMAATLTSITFPTQEPSSNNQLLWSSNIIEALSSVPLPPPY